MPFITKVPDIDEQHSKLRAEADFDETQSDVLRMADQLVREQEVEGGEIQPAIETSKPGIGTKALVNPIGATADVVKSGVQNMFRSLGGLAVDVAGSVANLTKGQGLRPEVEGTAPQDLVPELQNVDPQAIEVATNQLRQELLDLIGKPEEPGGSVGEQTVEELLRGLVQMLPLTLASQGALGTLSGIRQLTQSGGRFLPLLGKVLKFGGGGVIGDFLSISPEEPNIANLILSFTQPDPGLTKEVLDFIASPGDEGLDTIAERFMQRVKVAGIEGPVIGAAAEGLMKAGRVVGATLIKPILQRAKAQVRGTLGKAAEEALTPEDLSFLPGGMRVESVSPGGFRANTLEELQSIGVIDSLFVDKLPSGETFNIAFRDTRSDAQFNLFAIDEGEFGVEIVNPKMRSGDPSGVGTQLNSGDVRRILRIVAKQFPDIKTLEGRRLSGAKANPRRGGGPPVEGEDILDTIFDPPTPVRETDLPTIPTQVINLDQFRFSKQIRTASRSLEENGGFTVNAIRGDLGGTAESAVAPFPDIPGLSQRLDGRATEEQIQAFTDNARAILKQAGVDLDREPNLHIGGEFVTDPKAIVKAGRTGPFTDLDVSITTPPGRFRIAQAFGKQLNQRSILKDFQNFETIPTGGTGEGLDPGIIKGQVPPIQKRLQFMGILNSDAPAMNPSDTPFLNLRERLQEGMDSSVDENGEYVLGTIKRNKSGAFAQSGPTRNPVLQDLEILGASLLAKGVKDMPSFEKALKTTLDLPEGSFKFDDLEAIYQGAQGQFDRLMDKVANESGELTSASELLDLFKKGEFRKDWYDGVFDLFVRVFDGNADLFAKFVAATSPQAPADILENVIDPLTGAVKQRRIGSVGGAFKETGIGTSNLDMALRAYKAAIKARDTDEFMGFIRGDKDIGEAFPARFHNLIRAFEGGDIRGFKALPFYKNLVGIADAWTQDSWMGKAIFGREVEATRLSVGFMEETMRPLAQEMGVSLNQFQAAVWTAKKIQDELGDAFFEKPLSEMNELIRPLRKAVEDLIDEQIRLGNLDAKPLEPLFSAGIIPTEVKLRWGTTMLLSRALGGALFGGVTAEPDESRIRKALTFALGAAFLPTVRPKGFENMVDILVRATRRTVREQRRGLQASRGSGEDAFKAALEAADPQALRLGEGVTAVSPPKEIPLQRIPLAPDTPDSIARNYEELIRIQTRRSDLDIERGKFVRSDVRTAREAAEIKPHFTPDFVRRINPGTTMNDSEALALAQVMTDVGLKLKSLAEQARARGYDEASLTAFDEQLSLFMELDPKRLGVRAEAGRTERILGFEGAGARSQFLNQMSENVRNFVKGVPPHRRIDMIAGMDLDQIAVTAAGIVKPGYIDMFLEMWVNGLLSSVRTHVRNVVGNMTAFGASIAERGLARRFKNAGDVGAIAPGEATALLKGATGSMVDAWRLAWESFRNENAPRFGVSKFEHNQKAITSKALQEAGAFGAALDRLGTVIGLSGDRVGDLLRLPGRALVGADEFFKTINFQAELRAQAHRHAYDTATGEGLTGGARRVRMREVEAQLMLDPPESIKEAAKAFATYNTFQQALGPRGQHFQAFMDHPLGRIVMPFQRTPINLAKFAGERTPLAIASGKVVRELTSGDPARRQMALSKMYLGSMTMGMIGVLSASGLITSSGPKNSQQKRVKMGLGWQPTSLVIDSNNDGVRGGPGDTFIPLDKIEPFGSLIILAADAANAIANLKPDDPAIETITNAVTMAAVEAFNTRQFVMGFSNIIGVLSGKEENVQSFLKNFARGALPYSSAMRDVRKQVDPVFREARGVLDKIIDTIPFLSKNLRPARNLFGEVVPIPDAFGPDAVSFLTISKGKDEPVFSEMDRLEFTPARVPTKLAGGAVELNDKQIDRLAQLIGNPGTMGQTLREALMEEITDPSYSDTFVSDDQRKLRLQKIILDFKEEAIEVLRGEDKNLDAAIEEVENKLEELDERQRQAIPRLRGVTP